eukprot:scaffold56915_cov17-Tisochrysis_lutea.AAC.2
MPPQVLAACSHLHGRLSMHAQTGNCQNVTYMLAGGRPQLPGHWSRRANSSLPCFNRCCNSAQAPHLPLNSTDHCGRGWVAGAVQRAVCQLPEGALCFKPSSLNSPECWRVRPSGTQLTAKQITLLHRQSQAFLL